MNGDVPIASPPRRQGRGSFEVFLTSLHAGLLREMKNQFGRQRLGYFWALMEPMATVAILTGLHAGLRGAGALIYGAHPVVFFVFGAVPAFIFLHAVSRAQGVCSGLKGLFNYRQVRPIDMMIARTLVDALMMVAVAVLFIVGWGWWLGMPLTIADPLLLVVALISLYLLGLLLGLVFEVFGTVYENLKRVFGIAMRPIFFISGIFFTIGMIPEAQRHYLTWNPVLHAVDLSRAAVIPGYDSPASLGYVWLCIGVLMFVGLAAYRRYLYRLL